MVSCKTPFKKRKIDKSSLGEKCPKKPKEAKFVHTEKPEPNLMSLYNPMKTKTRTLK
jgi:hypothetical protein